MSAGPHPEPEEIVRLALEAISDRDPARLGPLLAPQVTIRTGRATHEGMDAALSWARKGYQHLDRRYVLTRLVPLQAEGGGGFVGEGRVEYVWRESGEVGDSRPAFFAIELQGGLIVRLELHDDRGGAAAALAT
jgi:hypothetical protein